MDDGVGGGQVEADPAGLQADQEDRNFTGLKAADRLFTVAGVAGKQRVVEAAGDEFMLDQRQHAGELRENENAPAFIDQFRQHRHQQVELGAFPDLARGVGLDKTRVAADLAQLQERVEDDDLAAAEALAGDFVAHLGVHRRAYRLVEVALPAFEFDIAHDDGLRRQLLRDVFLFAAQDEWPDAAGEQVAAPVVVLLFDRRPPVPGELPAAAEKTGQQEVELAPQLAEMILQRRTGQAQAVPGINLAHRFGAAALGVLDSLRLVEDEEVVAVPHQFVGVAPEQRIGSKHDVVFGDLRKALLALRAV